MRSRHRFPCKKGQAFSADAALALLLAATVLFVCMRAVAMAAENGAECGRETENELKALSLSDYLLREVAAVKEATEYGVAAHAGTIDLRMLSGLDMAAPARGVGADTVCVEFVLPPAAARCSGTCVTRPALGNNGGRMEAGYLVACIG